MKLAFERKKRRRIIKSQINLEKHTMEETFDKKDHFLV
jgi:hypothetical protein